jgi:hypothetical protein
VPFSSNIGANKHCTLFSMACPGGFFLEYGQHDTVNCVPFTPKLGTCASCPSGFLYAPKGLGAGAIEVARCEV